MQTGLHNKTRFINHGVPLTERQGFLMIIDIANGITEIGLINDTLSRWKGSNAKIWRFHPSLGRMAIQIYKPGQEQVLYLSGVSCQSINGPFHWSNCNISVIKSVLQQHELLATDLISDHTAPFELRCRGVVLTQGIIIDIDIYTE